MHAYMFRQIISRQSYRRHLSRCLLFGSTTTVLSANYSSTRAVTFLDRRRSDDDDDKPKDRNKSSDANPFSFLSAFFGGTTDKSSSSSSSSKSKEETEKQNFFNKERWEQLTRESSEQAQEFWNKITSNDDDDDRRGRKSDEEAMQGNKAKADVSGLASDFLKLFGGGKRQQQQAISEIVAKARETTSKSDVSDERSFRDLLEALNSYKEMINKVADKYISSIDLSNFEPTALFYYLEFEDERKNPSWKRRKHRFFDGIDIDRVERLNEYLDLARVSYADSVDDIQESLENHVRPCELLYAEVNSEPGKPANYVAIPRDQSKSSSHLEVIIGVRGTKSLADAITDLICEDVEYRGGKAHSFIVNSGKFIAKQHTKMLEDLLEHSGKSKLKVTLVGHSLGGGAASIAGFEFRDNEKFDVQVIGFGSPALVSQDLATKADFITTVRTSQDGDYLNILFVNVPAHLNPFLQVVNDSDMVPRMSGISVANLLMDVMQFDWFPYADRDAQEAIDALHERQPMIFNRDLMNKAKDILSPHIKEYANSKIVKKSMERAEVELFPPGKCIHIYRDGVGFSGSVVPNTFFSEIDVTRRMVDDHVFRTGYQQTFLELMRQHKGDHHFRFDEDVNIDSK